MYSLAAKWVLIFHFPSISYLFIYICILLQHFFLIAVGLLLIYLMYMYIILCSYLIKQFKVHMILVVSISKEYCRAWSLLMTTVR